MEFDNLRKIQIDILLDLKSVELDKRIILDFDFELIIKINMS